MVISEVRFGNLPKINQEEMIVGLHESELEHGRIDIEGNL